MACTAEIELIVLDLASSSKSSSPVVAIGRQAPVDESVYVEAVMDEAAELLQNNPGLIRKLSKKLKVQTYA